MPSWENTPATERACVQCGGPFTAKRTSAKYCSDKCRDRARGPRPYDSEATRRRRALRLTQPGYREQQHRADNMRHAALVQWLSEYKLRVGCVDCGYRVHAVALDFDHVGDLKTRNVSQAKSRKQAEAEIALCEVRCANCHRVKTHERRHLTSS